MDLDQEALHRLIERSRARVTDLRGKVENTRNSYERHRLASAADMLEETIGELRLLVLPRPLTPGECVRLHSIGDGADLGVWDVSGASETAAQIRRVPGTGTAAHTASFTTYCQKPGCGLDHSQASAELANRREDIGDA